jgi:hypothetical protein
MINDTVFCEFSAVIFLVAPESLAKGDKMESTNGSKAVLNSSSRSLYIPMVKTDKVVRRLASYKTGTLSYELLGNICQESDSLLWLTRSRMTTAMWK